LSRSGGTKAVLSRSGFGASSPNRKEVSQRRDDPAWARLGRLLVTDWACRAPATAIARRSPLAPKTVGIYNAMNRVTALSTPGGTADVTSTYYTDIAVNTLTAGNPSGNDVTTAYTYNKRQVSTQFAPCAK
jgi:hypothetical protein